MAREEKPEETKTACPACGYSLKIEQVTTSIVCPACGNTVMVEPEEKEWETAGGTEFVKPIYRTGPGILP